MAAVLDAELPSAAAEATPARAQEGVEGDAEVAAPGAVGALPFPGPAPLDEEELSGPASCCYGILMFFAYWFGANRFEHLENDRMCRKAVDAYLFTGSNSNSEANAAGSSTAAPAQGSVAGETAGEDAPASSDTQEDGNAQSAQPDGQRGALPLPRKPCCCGLFRTLEHEVVDLERVEVTGDNIVDRIEKTQSTPWFVILQVLVIFFTWFVWAIIKQKGSLELSTFNPMRLRAGFDDFFGGGASDGPTDLRVAGWECQDYRSQVYRWFTYQWTHLSAVQVVVNCFLLIIFGVPLNDLFGFWLTFLLHTTGVFCGALCYFWFDSHTPAIGTSGGIYAFVGVHIADYCINFRSKKFKKTIPIFIAALLLMDMLSYFFVISAEYTSGGPYLGGFFAGSVIGCLVYAKTRFLRSAAGATGVVFLVLSGLWLATQFAPRSIFEAMQGEPGYCWVRQFWDPSISDGWLCVRCGTQHCIDEWSRQQHLLPVRDFSECTPERLHYADPER